MTSFVRPAHWTWLGLALVALGGCSSDDKSTTVTGGSAGQGGNAGSAAATGGSAGSIGGTSGSAGSSAGSGGTGAGTGGTAGGSDVDATTSTGNDGGAVSTDAASSADALDSGRGDSSSDAGASGDLDSSAGDATAPDGGALPYSPCPPKGTPCKIMPLGDSITQDVSTSLKGGYRIPLLRKARAAGQMITFVGSTKTGPTMLDGQPFPQDNEGHSGWTIDNATIPGRSFSGLYPQIAGWMNATTPHIITLMIGTNDVNHALDLPNAPARLGKLIDRILQTDPKVLLVVAQIIPTRDDAAVNARIQTYNAAIPALVQERASAGQHIVMVDMYHAFTENQAFGTTYFNADNTGLLHPNDAGYLVMADVWYTAIGQLLR